MEHFFRHPSATGYCYENGHGCGMALHIGKFTDRSHQVRHGRHRQGVDTLSEYSALREMKIRYMQGYFLAWRGLKSPPSPVLPSGGLSVAA